MQAGAAPAPAGPAAAPAPAAAAPAAAAAAPRPSPAPELDAVVLALICSKVSCITTLARLRESSHALAAAAFAPLAVLRGRWDAWVAGAPKLDNPVISSAGQWRLDDAVMAFALSDATTYLQRHKHKQRKYLRQRAQVLGLRSACPKAPSGRKQLQLTKPAGWVMRWDDAWPARPSPDHRYDACESCGMFAYISDLECEDCIYDQIPSDLSGDSYGYLSD